MPALARPTSRRRATAAAAVLPVAAAVVLAPLTPAHAATEVFSSTFRGEFVDGSATRTSECTEVSTGVSARASRVEYFAFTTDTCAGGTVFTVGTAAPDVFEMTKDTAHVVATVAMRNISTGELTGEVVHIDNTWTATSKEPRTHSEPVVINFPGQYRLSERGWTRTVTASTSGTVPLDEASMSTGGFKTIAVVHDVE